MKYKTIAILVVSILLIATTAFAAQSIVNPSDSGTTNQSNKAAVKNPVQALQDFKSKIEQKYKDGKITEDEKNNILQKIDQKINELEAFNKLTPREKKDKLINDFTAAINQKVKDGKITQDKANQTIANYKAKIEKWDGNGYPPIRGFFDGMRHFGKGFGFDKDQFKDQFKEKVSSILDQAVKDGKISDQQKQDILGYIK